MLYIPLLFFLGFVLIFIVIPNVVRSARINASPVLTRSARVVAKRTQVWGHQRRTRTIYYATFELEGGSRQEFETTGGQFGVLVEGDAGSLVTQGPLLRSFQRDL